MLPTLFYLKNKLIGSIEIFKLGTKDNWGEIGYWMDKDYCRKGYMKEAVGVIEDFFFKAGLNKILIKCDEENLGSASVAKKSNYKLEGTLREVCFRDEDFIEPKYRGFRNDLYFGKLKSEWEQEKVLS